jgi:hypothetical protein
MTVELSFPGQPSRILIAPDQRLPDDFVFIRACEMPQKSLAKFLVNEHGKCTALSMPPSVQLDRKMALIDASLKRRRVPHFRKYISAKAEKALGVVLIISRMNFSKA